MNTPQTRPRSQNNFNALRLVAALMVLVGHHYALYGKPMPQPIQGQSFGSLAVATFFFISGYLIFQSWQRERQVMPFLIKRFFRILPPLVVASLFVVFIIGPLNTRLPLHDYFSSELTWFNLATNALGLHGTDLLAGVFENNPFAYSVNGSLWTIRYEWLMYLSIACLGVLHFIHKKTNVIALLMAMAVLWVYIHWFAAPAWKSYATHSAFVGDVELSTVLYLAILFYAGVLFSYGPPKSSPAVYASSAALLLIAVASSHPLFNAMLVWFLIPPGAIVLAYTGVRLLQSRPFNDISYGIYIYAFPIQQTVCSYALNNHVSFVASMLVSIACTMLMACFSWFCIERPAIQMGRNLAARIKLRPVSSV